MRREETTQHNTTQDDHVPPELATDDAVKFHPVTFIADDEVRGKSHLSTVRVRVRVRVEVRVRVGVRVRDGVSVRGKVRVRVMVRMRVRVRKEVQNGR